ncbi:MAG: chemotaxis protein histidine kinase-like protein [Gammaproteobacteria bacterium]|nr:MAG: chemotaxis protein histidine kinase-like protein [Gammaproteobacteria bacterium]
MASLRGILSADGPAAGIPVKTAPPPATENKPAGKPVEKPTQQAPLRAAAPPVERDHDKAAAGPLQKDGASAGKDRMLRINASRLDRLMGLAGETLVESRWLTPFATSMNRVKRRQGELIAALDNLRESLSGVTVSDYAASLFKDVEHKANECRSMLSERMTDLEQFDRRTSNIANNLHHEAIASRMRPFSDGVQGLQRLVRDLARQLGKKAKLDIHGANTQVDRDVLEKIKAPLDHMIRNALDHGIDTAEERALLGKPEVGSIRLEAFHNAGMLSIVMADDGRGVDLDRLRDKIVAKGLVNQEMAGHLSDSELLEFLFLPSFSTRDSVTDMSGRGVGMDVVHDTVKEMGGMVRATSVLGKGMRIQMQLPLTLSVLRALLVKIGGESYAFPLARIDRILKLPRSSIEMLENQQYFTLQGDHIGLVSGCQVFGKRAPEKKPKELPVIVVADRNGRFGLVVDEFIGERELAVQVLDSRLGKVKDVSAAALLEDGAPTLIADIDDVVRSIDKLVNEAQLRKVDSDYTTTTASRKRILVVDDSITVREVERNLLKACGYDVEVAVDGMDGWNAVRSGMFNLVITDIDMPRMDGISLVTKMKGDDKYKAVPVMIVSYKDREEDRRRGLSAGADYYLTKGSFHDETLREAVIDLIGEAL